MGQAGCGVGEIGRAEVVLLRAAAEALVEDCPEPRWGLAQELSLLCEAMVRASPELSAGEAGCAACGEGGGGHCNWCIHAFVRPARADDAGEDDQGFVDIMRQLGW